MVSRLLWVAGGRDYRDVAAMRRVLVPFADDGWSLITGAQRGADKIAEDMWRGRECPYIGIPAKFGVQGRGAGPQRNWVIARDWKPLLLVYFPGGVGTRSARRAASAFKIETRRGLSEVPDAFRPDLVEYEDLPESEWPRQYRADT